MPQMLARSKLRTLLLCTWTLDAVAQRTLQHISRPMARSCATPCSCSADAAAQKPAGAGDLFAAGFLYGLMRGYPLQRCARIGCLAGGAVVQSLGAELSPANWRWLFSR